MPARRRGRITAVPEVSQERALFPPCDFCVHWQGLERATLFIEENHGFCVMWTCAHAYIFKCHVSIILCILFVQYKITGKTL